MALALFPLNFLPGTMFPKGIAYLEDHSPELISWASGSNGATLVISAIGSALPALTYGCAFVVAHGASPAALSLRRFAQDDLPIEHTVTLLGELIEWQSERGDESRCRGRSACVQP